MSPLYVFYCVSLVGTEPTRDAPTRQREYAQIGSLELVNSALLLLLLLFIFIFVLHHLLLLLTIMTTITAMTRTVLYPTNKKSAHFVL